MSVKLYNDTCVLRAHPIIGDWSNGMIGVSKTFGGSSILSSPACEKALKHYVSRLFCYNSLLHARNIFFS
mgnify:CR=1 FL=1